MFFKKIKTLCQNKFFPTILHSGNFSVYMSLPTPTVCLFLSALSFLSHHCALPPLHQNTWQKLHSQLQYPQGLQKQLPYCAAVVQDHGQQLMPQTHTLLLLVMYENRFFYFSQIFMLFVILS